MRILLVDGGGLISTALRQALEGDGGFEIVGEVRGAGATISSVADNAPEVVLLDARILGRDALGLVRILRTHYPEVVIVMCAMPCEPELIRLALRAGARGCLLNSINPKDVGAAVRHAVDQTAYHAPSPPIVDEDEAARLVGLTQRETQAMRALARGLSNKEIADELFLTVPTVKSHLTSLYRKLGVSNRTEAAGWALGPRARACGKMKCS
jgi:DNA-binding NarL/FixJ family response regulator